MLLTKLILRMNWYLKSTPQLNLSLGIKLLRLSEITDIMLKIFCGLLPRRFMGRTFRCIVLGTRLVMEDEPISWLMIYRSPVRIQGSYSRRASWTQEISSRNSIINSATWATSWKNYSQTWLSFQSMGNILEAIIQVLTVNSNKFKREYTISHTTSSWSLISTSSPTRLPSGLMWLKSPSASKTTSSPSLSMLAVPLKKCLPSKLKSTPRSPSYLASRKSRTTLLKVLFSDPTTLWSSKTTSESFWRRKTKSSMKKPVLLILPRNKPKKRPPILKSLHLLTLYLSILISTESRA